MDEMPSDLIDRRERIHKAEKHFRSEWFLFAESLCEAWPNSTETFSPIEFATFTHRFVISCLLLVTSFSYGISRRIGVEHTAGRGGEKKRWNDTDTKDKRKMAEKPVARWNKIFVVWRLCALVVVNFVGIKAADRIARFKYEVACTVVRKRGLERDECPIYGIIFCQ